MREPEDDALSRLEDSAAELADLGKTLRDELDRTTFHHAPMFSLPLAQVVRLRTAPDLASEDERRCAPKPRVEWDPPGGYYQPTIVQRWEVRCGLPMGHVGPHMAPYEGPNDPRRAWLKWEEPR